jgi:hypothetical protein
MTAQLTDTMKATAPATMPGLGTWRRFAHTFPAAAKQINAHAHTQVRDDIANGRTPEAEWESVARFWMLRR